MKWGVVSIGFSSPFFYEKMSLLKNHGLIIIKGEGRHVFSPGVEIIVDQKGTLEVGNNFWCSRDLRIDVAKRITIGSDNLWSYNIEMRDSDGHRIFDLSGKRVNEAKEIFIGDHVWIGARCTVQKGISIDDDNIIGACTLLTKSVCGKNGICVGNGSHKIKDGVTWER